MGATLRDYLGRDPQRVKVTCTDPQTGESETQELDPHSYIIICGEHMHVAHEQVFPQSGTVQLTIKRRQS